MLFLFINFLINCSYLELIENFFKFELPKTIFFPQGPQTFCLFTSSENAVTTFILLKYYAGCQYLRHNNSIKKTQKYKKNKTKRNTVSQTYTPRGSKYLY